MIEALETFFPSSFSMITTTVCWSLSKKYRTKGNEFTLVVDFVAQVSFPVTLYWPILYCAQKLNGGDPEYFIFKLRRSPCCSQLRPSILTDEIGSEIWIIHINNVLTTILLTFTCIKIWFPNWVQVFLIQVHGFSSSHSLDSHFYWRKL